MIITNLTSNYSRFIWLFLLMFAVYFALIIIRQLTNKEKLHMDGTYIKPAIVGFVVLFITPGLVRTLGALVAMV